MSGINVSSVAQSGLYVLGNKGTCMSAEITLFYKTLLDFARFILASMYFNQFRRKVVECCNIT